MLRLEVDPRYGRLARVSQNCDAGRVLLRSENFCTVVSVERLRDICSHCMKAIDGGKGFACSRCGTIFCKQDCLEAAGAQHTLECSVLHARKCFNGRLLTDDETQRLAIRCLSRKLLEAKASLDELHFDNVSELLCHETELQDSMEWRDKLSDAKSILSWFPAVSGGPTLVEVARLLLRIKFNAHPITNGRLTSVYRGAKLMPVTASSGSVWDCFRLPAC
eukprot:752477-Hanusia_phi.AAC.3